MPTLGITDLWTYVLGTLFIILLPGPNSLFVLATAAQRGVAAGYRAASAVFIGDAVLMLLSALGIASLLKAEPMLFLGLKYLGAAYLFYLGVGMLRGGWRKLQQPQVSSDAVEQVDVNQPFRKALLLSLSNPKAILFFVSFFIQFVDPAYAYPGLSFLVLGTILELISALYLSFLIFSGVRLAAWFRRRQRLAAGASSGVGALFVGFGVKLASATLS
ncbi:leucine efflux protein LeuE [Pseudomonas schmalbachii]|uniref:Leucine efflux protein LeuE n=1 Tax=Pseudomonas schmalbachii TaxID=2816993 RepID=A0ABS3TSR0_9PSED|nr:leucine efflux protein LeuE [Pseudomonas schmalbachii]MBO3276706.1 leucine efflux protein LeuE [Pseudomonas schmalbachii]